MGELMLGDVVAQSVYTELAARIRALLRPPGLRVLRVGDDPASIAYVRLKDKKARALGIESQVLVLPEHTPEEDVLAVLNNLNSDPNVDGILVQLPLPPQINPSYAGHRSRQGRGRFAPSQYRPAMERSRGWLRALHPAWDYPDARSLPGQS